MPEPGPPPVIEGAPTSVAAFVGWTAQGPVNTPVSVTSFAEYQGAFGGLDAGELGWSVQSFFAAGGADAVVVNAGGAQPVGVAALVGDASEKSGLHALDGPFNLLCVPDLRTLDGDAHQTVVAAMVAFAQAHSALAIVDLPSRVATASDAASWTSDASAALGDAASYAAAYWPEIEVEIPAGGRRRIAASGAVAGVTAATDVARGVWKAAAGLAATLTGAVAVAVALSDADQGAFAPLGLNAIRTFPSAGVIVWGARTLAGADSLGSEWKYITVRRTALFIEASLQQGLTWTVFEPNAPALWARITLSASTFMTSLFRAGAFAGATAQDAFLVRCDAATTTADDIAAGVVNLVVGFAAVQPAEFVILQIALLAGADS